MLKLLTTRRSGIQTGIYFELHLRLLKKF